MSTVIELVKVPTRGIFGGFRQFRNGQFVGLCVAEQPIYVWGGETLTVEIRNQDEEPKVCRVVRVDRPIRHDTSLYRTELSSSRCRSTKKKQPPLNAAERAAIKLQSEVKAAETADAELRRIEEKQAISTLFHKAMLCARDERVIRLKFLHDVEQGVIAKQLNVSSQRIKAIEVRGLKKLRRVAFELARQGAI